MSATGPAGAPATITFAPAFRRHVDCPDEAVATPPGAVLRELLHEYFARHPGAATYVLDDAGALRRHVTIFVDGEQVNHRVALDHSVSPGGTVYVFQALSGG